MHTRNEMKEPRTRKHLPRKSRKTPRERVIENEIVVGTYEQTNAMHDKFLSHQCSIVCTHSDQKRMNSTDLSRNILTHFSVERRLVQNANFLLYESSFECIRIGTQLDIK